MTVADGFRLWLGKTLAEVALCAVAFVAVMLILWLLDRKKP